MIRAPAFLALGVLALVCVALISRGAETTPSRAVVPQPSQGVTLLGALNVEPETHLQRPAQRSEQAEPAPIETKRRLAHAAQSSEPIRRMTAYFPGAIVLRLIPIQAVSRRPLEFVPRALGVSVRSEGREWSGRFDGRRATQDKHLAIALDPAVPRGRALSLELTFNDGRTRDAWHATVDVALPASDSHDLGEVPFERRRNWVKGTVNTHSQHPIQGALVEVMEFIRGDPRDRAFVADAHGLVDSQGRFKVMAPGRPLSGRARVRLVRSDGVVLEHESLLQTPRTGVVLRAFRELEVAGQARLGGASAAGLFTLQARVGLEAVGVTTVQADGSFTIEGLPEIPGSPIDVVFTAKFIGGELHRVSGISASDFRVQPSGRGVLRLGNVELGRRADLLELELIDGRGQPAAGQLSWCSRHGQGRTGLRAAPYHQFLVVDNYEHRVEVLRTGGLDPLPLRGLRGRQRIIVDP